jgi:hypothetical protein
MSLHRLPLILLILCLSGCAPQRDSLLIGAKIYEHRGPYSLLFEQWNDLGINTGFCSQDLIADNEFMEQAREHHISTFLIFPVFFNPEALAQSPELAAITQDGSVASEEWVEFVCPSRKDYRKQVVEKARKLVQAHRPDGISIDFIRHFVYWEKVYPDRDPASLPVACFDSVCLDHFQAETGIRIPTHLGAIPDMAAWILANHQEEWTAWRCGLITSMVREIAEAVRAEKPDILVNIHLVPWAEKDFDGGLRRVAGQDIPALSQYADLLSPMTYAHMVKQSPAWVHEITEAMDGMSSLPVIPSIQVGQAYLDTEYGLKEFRETVEKAIMAPSGGVILWSWERLTAEPEKVELFREILRKR